MKRGKDISTTFQNLEVVHQNVPGKRVESIALDRHLLFLPLQGEISLQADDRRISAAPGQMLYLAPKTSHSFSSSSTSGERLIAMLEKKALLFEDRPRAVKMPLNQLIKEILFYLLLHPQTRNAKSLVRVFSETLQETLQGQSQSLDGSDSEGRVSDPRVRGALQQLRKSVRERRSMDEIAAAVGMSSRNFHRLVLKETGLPPRQWLIRFRIERAKELLKAPGATVTSVAMDVGYQSLSQFIAAFRASTGQLPSQFLKIG